MNGFGKRDRAYSLKINHNDTIHAIDFVVTWQGSVYRTDKRAIATAVSIFAIAQYGRERNTAYDEIATHLGEDSCEAILALYEALQGQRFTGKVRSQDGTLLSAMATHMGMVDGVRQYEARDVARRLA